MMDWLLVDAARTLGLPIHVQRCASILLEQWVLDFPVIDLCTDAELEVFLGDGIPELVGSS